MSNEKLSYSLSQILLFFLTTLSQVQSLITYHKTNYKKNAFEKSIAKKVKIYHIIGVFKTLTGKMLKYTQNHYIQKIGYIC